MNLQGRNLSCDLSGLELDIADKWILTRLNRVAAEVTENMEKFELGLACGKVYDFIWSEFCDWYIEMCKVRLYDGSEAQKDTAASVLAYTLTQALKRCIPSCPSSPRRFSGNVALQARAS